MQQLLGFSSTNLTLAWLYSKPSFLVVLSAVVGVFAKRRIANISVQVVCTYTMYIRSILEALRQVPSVS